VIFTRITLTGKKRGYEVHRTYRNKRLNPHLVFEEVRSILAVLFNYIPKGLSRRKDNLYPVEVRVWQGLPGSHQREVNHLISFIKQEFGK